MSEDTSSESRHYHERTVEAMSLTTIAGMELAWLACHYGIPGLIAGFLLAAGIGRVAFWWLPSAETIALQWGVEYE